MVYTIYITKERSTKLNRDIIKCFRVNDSENEEIMRRMSELHIEKESAYLRKMALNGYIVDLNSCNLQKLFSSINKCGSNLNQYARHANQTGVVLQEEIKTIKEEFDEILEGVKDIVKILTKIA